MKNRYEELAKIFERDEFDDSAALFLTVENGELQMTPIGGTFKRGGHFQGEEVYQMLRFLLEKSTEYDGCITEESRQ